MEDGDSRTWRSIKSYTALSLWLILAFVFLSLGKQWILFTSTDKQLTDYVDTLERQAALHQRAASDIRTLVLLKVQQLSIPVQEDQISVTGQGDSLRTIIAYNEDIRIPVVDRVLYRMEFNHNLALPARR
jgi:hypothetical protein